jgi:hypothetical protein
MLHGLADLPPWSALRKARYAVPREVAAPAEELAAALPAKGAREIPFNSSSSLRGAARRCARRHRNRPRNHRAAGHGGEETERKQQSLGAGASDETRPAMPISMNSRPASYALLQAKSLDNVQGVSTEYEMRRSWANRSRPEDECRASIAMGSASRFPRSAGAGDRIQSLVDQANGAAVAVCCPCNQIEAGSALQFSRRGAIAAAYE